MSTDYDLIIIGGGLVGASLAYALQHSKLNIALIEATNIELDEQPSYDDRGIALAYGSQRIFETMGIWSQFSAHCTPINTIHISDRGHLGVTRLSAQKEKVPALGQVVTARAIGLCLNKAIQALPNLTLITPKCVIAVSQQEEKVTITLDDNQQLSAKLIAAADGGQSSVRQLLNLGAFEQDYQQTAITANISTERAHQGCAYERFTDSGPLALLPMSDNRSSLVWTVKSGDEEHILASSDELFLKQLQERFGYRLGKFTRVGKRHSYPLKLIECDQPIQHRIVFIGNAAHSLHPIAGQGFNLGLRDVAALAEVITDSTHSDIGSSKALYDYKQWRQADQDSVIKATSQLVNIFSNDYTLIGHGRGAGLTMLDMTPSIKSHLAKKSMGLTGRQPKLARGVPL
jgi:2-octaprenyl-6-methoxyphenol hydroxylase